MAYTNSWDESAPLGSAAANTIDDIIRTLKVDIRERMNTVLASDGQWDDDPIRLEGVLKTGQQLLISPHGAIGADENDTVDVFDRWVQGPGTLRWTLPVQKNWKITKVECVIDKNSASSVDVKFNKVSFDTSPTTTLVDSVSHSETGIKLVEVFSGEETLNGGSVYHIETTPDSTAVYKIYGFRITYDEVSS